MSRFNPYLPDLNPTGPGDDEDEGLFGRDISGQLVRVDTPTENDYDQRVTVWIDAEKVEVPVARPLEDAQGNIIVDIDDQTFPRRSTIYDAMVKLRKDKVPCGRADQTWICGTDSCTRNEEPLNPIPVLCHQPHITPVAVCRLCMVLVAKEVESKEKSADGTGKLQLKLERRLAPACHRLIVADMHVFTMKARYREGYIADKETVEAAANQVRQAVEVLHELLSTDHLKPPPSPAPKELDPINELRTLKTDYKLDKTRFDLLNKHCQTSGKEKTLPAHKPVDKSSLVFLVDHAACILCDRCSRACNEVKGNNIIGRTGKGAAAAIGFDLNEPMGKSGCVQCGECMVSCPTSAITFKPVGRVKVSSDREKKHTLLTALTIKKKPHKPIHEPQVLTAAELIRGRDWLFAGVPPKFLLWQEGLVRRRRVEKEDRFLCRQGDPGNTAFFIKSGKFKIVGWDKKGQRTEYIRGAADTVLGEMACISGKPRIADIEILEGGEVLEVRRNVLDRIMRSRGHRELFQKIYRDRAMQEALRDSELFEDLEPELYAGCWEFLQDKLAFIRVGRGQRIFKQGEWAGDALYLVRLGHVRIGIELPGGDENVRFRGPGSVVGEMALLAIDRQNLPADPDDREATIQQIDDEMNQALDVPTDQLLAAWPRGQRTANCSALDDLELARVSRADFLQLVKLFPAVRRRLIEIAVDRLLDERAAGNESIMRDYVEQGLYQAQNLLALDLDKCTRCDECVMACVKQHGKESHGVQVTRLKRDGLRFGNQLVASSCRSCKDAYCIIGCPVDSIHRGKHKQIIIEDHCIGCGLCERSCPYGNIWMVENQLIKLPGPEDPENTTRTARSKAVTCDLCDAHGDEKKPKPRCVSACPHDAAHRMTGEELLKLVRNKKE